MTWSFTQARRAAADLLAAPLGSRAIATARPRSVLGIVRSRAPTPMLLYVAARDGLVVEDDNGGWAVLRRPTAEPQAATGGYLLRTLRWLDRRWDFVMFGAPPAVALLAGIVTAHFPATRAVAVALAAGCSLWVALFLFGMLAWQLWRAVGAGPSGQAAAESLAASNWHVPLVHQPDPGQVDDLAGLLMDRLAVLVWADLQASAADLAKVGRVELTRPLVVLTSGISTPGAADAMARSVRAIPGEVAWPGTVVLAAPARLDRAPARQLTSGGFLLLYAAGLALVIAVASAFVAVSERRACAPVSCQSRPASYGAALRFLLQRLLLSDPRGLAPGTTAAVVIGWLVSVAGLMLVVVAIVAGRSAIAGNRQRLAAHDRLISGFGQAARVLILVVTRVEREAVLAAVRERVRSAPALDRSSGRTIYALGVIGGAELLLAQAAEQGTGTAGGMLITASEVISQVNPDYVVLAGICFGLRPEHGQQLGDIVVASRIQNIDPRKVSDDADRPVLYRGVHVSSSPVLLDRFTVAETTWAGQRVHFGLVLTSNTLVDSARVVGELRRDFPDAVAGEMESAGVYEAAVTADAKPDWIMVKGISDWGRAKDDDAQPLAARNAAEFIASAIASAGLRRRR